MDLKSLIAKMDQIESKKFLAESKDKGDMDHDGKDEADSEEWEQNRDTAIKNATGKEKEVDEDAEYFKGAIAQALLKEFGLDEKVTLGTGPAVTNPETGVTAGQFQGQTGGFYFSPEQEKWLGGANYQDPYILARMPGPKPPISFFKDPEDQAIAKRMGFPTTVEAPVPAAEVPTAEVPTAEVPAAPEAPDQPVSGATSTENIRLQRFKELLNKAIEKPTPSSNPKLQRFKELLTKSTGKGV